MTMLKDDALRKTEHFAVREKVGYYDFTHQLLEVTGKDAAAFLDMIYVNAVGTAKNGTAKYTTMLNPEGQILDDVIVFRMEDEVFRISTLYINELMKWLDAHKEGFEVSYRDITPENTMFAVQGPQSRALLNRILEQPVDDLGFYAIRAAKIGDIAVYIARSGFTGELGYEIYCTPKMAVKVEETLVANGEEFGLTKITTDVIIGSLPREKGYVLMQDLKGANPYEVGFGWTVSKKKDFIGKEATDKLLEDGVTRDLLGFELLSGDEVAPGDAIMFGDTQVGVVTSFTYGYTVEKYIGYSLISAPAKAGDKVQIGDNKVEALLCERVWYDKDNSRTRQ